MNTYKQTKLLKTQTYTQRTNSESRFGRKNEKEQPKNLKNGRIDHTVVYNDRERDSHIRI